jgi:outer membrane receptor protein involved in Fe transport
MKKILAAVIVLMGNTMAFSQAPIITSLEVNDGKISGTVIDSATQKPVEFATVALMKAGSDTPVNGSVCDDSGKFIIKSISPGKYSVVVSFIGYEPKSLSVTVAEKNNDIDLGKIFISVTAEILKEITIEGQKSLIEEKVDRTIFNAENDMTSKGGDASDVLRRVPMLTVDLDGNVSLRGNQNIQVLINNKPSTIIASNIGDALKQIPADQIKTVEVITSPSAKYDAEGSAGIINIITKKNNLEGLTLNVDAGIGLRGSNLGLNGNYRRKKMGFSLGGWGRANYNTTGKFENTQVTAPNTSNALTTIQTANTLNQGVFGNYTLGWDYDITDKTFLTSSVRFGVRNFRREQNSFLTESYNALEELETTSLADVLNHDRSNNVDATFTFTKQFETKQKELSFQGQYSRNDQKSLYENMFLEGTYPQDDITNKNKSYNQEVTFQVDYQTPIGKNQLLEFGGKDIMRKVFSDYTTTNRPSNNLNYDQNVLAGYTSLTKSFEKGYSLKAGARYEYTVINAYSQTDDDIEIPSYGVLVPSVNVSKKLKNSNTLKLSYNRRIQRPSIRYLNPNPQFQNNLNVTIGNPELSPEYTNNFELGYSTFIKGTSLNFTAFVRNTNDAIQSLRNTYRPTPTDSLIILTTYENIGLENAYGTSIFANVNIGKLSLNGGGDVYYAVLDNKNPDDYYHAQNEGFVISGRVFGSYNLDKGWAVQFFGFGRGRNVQLQGYQGNFRMYSLGLRKEFKNKKGSIGFGAENFLSSSIKIKSETITPDVEQYSVNTMNNMSFRVNVSFRIGKMSMDQRPSRRKSINNDDLKDGGDNGGGGGMEGGAPMGGGGQRTGGGMTGGGAKTAGAAAIVKKDQVAKTDSTAVGEVKAEGSWEYTIDSPQGGAGTFVIKKDGDVYSGTIINNRMQKEQQLSDVKLAGAELSFSYEVNFGGNTNTIMVSGTITGNEFNGNMAVGQFGTFPMNGKRKE